MPSPVWLPLAIALQFLTRIPIRLPSMPTADQQRASLYWYPLVGLLLGGLWLGSAWLLSGLDSRIGAFLLLALTIGLTGGLHLDGLADSSDAWLGGYGCPERSLRIMKDPYCGPAGALSLILSCLGKWLSLQLLLEQPLMYPLLLVPLLSRSLIPWLFWWTPYLRSSGLGQHFRDALQLSALIPGTLLCLLLVLCAGWPGLLLLGTALVSFYGLRRLMLTRLGGTTGDTAGALIELTELGLLLILAMTLTV